MNFTNRFDMVNDFQYITGSERKWTYGITTKMYFLMERILTKLVNFISKWKTKQSKSLHKSREKIYNHTTKIHIKATQLLVMATIFSAKIATKAHAPRSVYQWDTYSGLIVIDNKCSACMLNFPTVFYEDL